MTKTELANAVAKRSHILRSQAFIAVDVLFATIAETLNKGEPIVIQGLGTFHVINHPGLTSQFNVVAQKKTVAPPFRRLVFKSATAFKRYINGKAGIPFRVPVE